MIAVVDRIVQYANRYKLTDVSTGMVLGTFDFDAVTGTVQAVGTEINKELFDSIASDIAAKLTANGGDSKDCIITFGEAQTLENIASGESHSTIFGKIKKWFSARISSLKAFAYDTSTKVAKTDLASSVQTSLGLADSSLQPADKTALETAIGGKVDKVTGYGLSKNDFTDALKTKLDGIANSAEVNVQSDWNETDDTKDAYIKNKPNLTSLLDAKVDKVTGKQLSTEDYTTADKNKLAGLVGTNVRYDTSQTLTDAQKAQARSNIGAGQSKFSGNYNDLTNKPTIPDELADLSSDSTHRTVTDTEKATWNGKQDALSSQTAYSAKGTTTKVPQITTNELGQVTGITEKNIAFPVTSVNGETGEVTGYAKQSMLSNPNLLINSNFAINQRQGYYAPVGTVVYSDSACTNPIGTLATAIQTTLVSSTVRKATGASVAGSTSNTYSQGGTSPTIALTYLPNTSTISASAETSGGAAIQGVTYNYFSSGNSVAVFASDAAYYAVSYSLQDAAQTVSGIVYFKTSDCTSGYAIISNGTFVADDWVVYISSSGVLATLLDNGGITIANNSSNNTADLTQIIEDGSKLYSGKGLTLSVNTTIDGSTATTILSGALSGAGTLTANLPSSSGQIHIQWISSGVFKVWLRTYTGKTITYNWAKLEMGAIATSYVAPTIEEELPKCMRHFFRLQSTDTLFIAEGHAGSATSAYFPFNFPMPMRVAPTVTLSAMSDFNLYSVSGSAIAITNLYASRFDKWNTRCTLNITSSGMASQGSYILRAKFPNSYIDFDASMK